MSNEDLCQFVSYQLTVTDDLAKVSSAVVDYCLYKVRFLTRIIHKYWKLRIPFLSQGSRDNMSIVLVTFPAAPKPIPEVVEREQRFEEFIRTKTLGIFF